MKSVAELQDRLATLGLRIPETIAFLPLNFDLANDYDKAFFSRHTPVLERVLLENNISLEDVSPSDDRVYLDARADDLLLPVLFVTRELLQSEGVLSVVLSVIANYLYGWLTSIGSNSKVRMKILIKKGDEIGELHYRGPAEGLQYLGRWTEKEDK